MSDNNVLDHHQSDDANGSDSDDDSSSVESIQKDHGRWKDDPMDVPWNGCVCGQIHARPIRVFWIQCEGPCQAWYNVAPKCVNGLTEKQASSISCVWNCNDCISLNQKRRAPALKLLVELPPDLLFRILEFCARPTYRAAVLQTQISPLCKVTRHFVQGDKSRGLWEAIRKHDYSFEDKAPRCTIKSSPQKQAESAPTSPTSRQRAPKRRRKSTDFLTPNRTLTDYMPKVQDSNLRQSVIREHSLLMSRNYDAYMTLEELADPMASRKRGQGQDAVSSPSVSRSSSSTRRPLSLQRLRGLIRSFDHALDVNRPSPFSGRTFLHVCCAAELNEANIVRCVSYLLQEQGADPSIMSTKESPFANCPVLYFAIARVMPKLIDILIKAGASLTVQVKGQFRRTFDPTKTIRGRFTPLEYAREVKRVEAAASAKVESSNSDDSAPNTARSPSGLVPPYWMTKLNNCIRILAEASSSS